MVLMALVPLVGVGILTIAVVMILHRSDGRQQVAKTGIDKQVGDKLKKAKDLDSTLAQEVLGGADFDTALDEFRKKRAGIFALSTDTPWLWDVEDLHQWAKTQSAVQVAAINSKARLVALTLLVAITLLVLGIEAVLYNHLSTPQALPRPATLPAVLPVPNPTSVAGPSAPPSNP